MSVAGLSAILVLALAPLSAYAATAQSGPTDHEDDPVVVSQGKAALRMSDIDARVARIPEDKRAGFMDNPERIEQLLTNLLMLKQLAAEAKEVGMHEEPAIRAELALATDEVLAKHQLARKVANAEVPDFTELAYERYVANPEMHTSPEMVDVRHLVIRNEIHGKENARKLAQSLRDKYLAEGGDFEAFVKSHSEEPKVELHGGVLKRLSVGQNPGDFEDAAFALERPGDISPVVQSRHGYHLIQLMERHPPVRQTFEQASAGIKASLAADHRARIGRDLLQALQSDDLNADPELVRSLRFRYFPEGSERRLMLEGESEASSPDSTGKDSTVDAGLIE